MSTEFEFQPLYSEENNKTEIYRGKIYDFNPKSDITIHELARLVPIIFKLLHSFPSYEQDKFMSELPPEIRRHFSEGETWEGEWGLPSSSKKS